MNRFFSVNVKGEQFRKILHLRSTSLHLSGFGPSEQSEQCQFHTEEELL